MTLLEKFNIWNCVNYSIFKIKTDNGLYNYWLMWSVNNPEHKLFEFLGWQGGTIHQAVNEIAKLKKELLNT